MPFGDRKTKPVLLTGAGFSHNFGAPLTGQLWASVFNLCSSRESLRKELLKSQNFEEVYGAVVNGALGEPDRAAMTEALRQVFREIDDNIARYPIGSDRTVDTRTFHRFINSFAGLGKGESGFIFTLNQDMALERLYFDDTEAVRFYQPGLRQIIGEMRERGHRALGDDLYRTLTGDEFGTGSIRAEVLRERHRLYYIKLHGSQNWLSSDGTQRLVMGTRKQEQISREPLLKAYWTLFSEVVGDGDARLLAIGYSFSDEHVNEVLADAVSRHGLKLYVLSPQGPDQWIQQVRLKPYGVEIAKHLFGYYEATLGHLMPPSMGETQMYKHLKGAVFG